MLKLLRKISSGSTKSGEPSPLSITLQGKEIPELETNDALDFLSNTRDELIILSEQLTNAAVRIPSAHVLFCDRFPLQVHVHEYVCEFCWLNALGGSQFGSESNQCVLHRRCPSSTVSTEIPD